MTHQFISGINLGKLKLREAPAPYRPILSNNPFDVSNFEEEYTT